MLTSQRALFDIPGDVCYLNAASYSPLPLATLEAGRKAVARKGRPWLIDGKFAAKQYERARKAAARLTRSCRCRPVRAFWFCRTIIPRRCWNG
jgi:hypothetical protein